MQASAARPTRYTGVAIALHWLMALGVVALIVIGLSMTHLGLAPATKFKLYQLHKSIGVTILLAALLRLAWRLTHRPPALPDMPPLERFAAQAAHVLLYLWLLALPLTGWAVVSASPFNLPTVLYGVLPWPHLPIFADLADKAPVYRSLKLIHAALAWALIALIAGHAGAALRHHFILRDGVLARMSPFAKTAGKAHES
jgi:cytochrome b561